MMFVHAEFRNNNKKKLVFKAAKPKRSRKEKSKQRKIVTVNDGERAKEDLEGND